MEILYQGLIKLEDWIVTNIFQNKDNAANYSAFCKSHIFLDEWFALANTNTKNLR